MKDLEKAIAEETLKKFQEIDVDGFVTGKIREKLSRICGARENGKKEFAALMSALTSQVITREEIKTRQTGHKGIMSGVLITDTIYFVFYFDEDQLERSGVWRYLADALEYGSFAFGVPGTKFMTTTELELKQFLEEAKI